MFLISENVASTNDIVEFCRTFDHHTSTIPVFVLILSNINENPQRFPIVQKAGTVSLGPLNKRIFALLRFSVTLKCLNDVLKDGFLMEDDLLRLRLQFLINNLVFMNPNTPKIANKLAEKTQP